MGQRQRYRLLGLERLCCRSGSEESGDVRKSLEAGLAEVLAREQVRREPCWTESLAVGSLAVGSASYVARIKPLVLSRQETAIVQEAEGLWALREAEVPYGDKTTSKNQCSLHSAAQKRRFLGFLSR